jgi:hypothetical protein
MTPTAARSTDRGTGLNAVGAACARESRGAAQARQSVPPIGASVPCHDRPEEVGPADRSTKTSHRQAPRTPTGNTPSRPAGQPRSHHDRRQEARHIWARERTSHRRPNPSRHTARGHERDHHHPGASSTTPVGCHTASRPGTRIVRTRRPPLPERSPQPAPAQDQPHQAPSTEHRAPSTEHRARSEERGAPRPQPRGTRTSHQPSPGGPRGAEQGQGRRPASGRCPRNSRRPEGPTAHPNRTRLVSRETQKAGSRTPGLPGRTRGLPRS